MQNIQNIVLIGAGNVATQLAFALEHAGLQIVQVYSRTTTSAEKLAGELYTEFITDLSALKPDADLYILSLTDDATVQAVQNINLQNKLVVHTSGSLDMEILSTVSENYGVFYPLQTFSKNRKAIFKNIPICLEANSDSNMKLLIKLAGKISGDVREVNSTQRHKIHLAAVFACNFPNFMYTIAEKILEGSGLDFDILKPLITETAAKVQLIKPVEAQTGPAIRKDNKIMDVHLQILNNYPEYKELYKLISLEIGKGK